MGFGRPPSCSVDALPWRRDNQRALAPGSFVWVVALVLVVAGLGPMLDASPIEVESATGRTDQVAPAQAETTQSTESAPTDAPPDRPAADVGPLVSLLELVIQANPSSARQSLAVLADKIQSGELSGERLQQLRPRLIKIVAPVLEQGEQGELYLDALLLAASMKDDRAIALAVEVLRNQERSVEERMRAFTALVSTSNDGVLNVSREILSGRQPAASEMIAAILQGLGRTNHPEVAEIVLEHYQRLDAELQPKAIDLLTQRAAWSKQLLRHIGRQQIPATVLNTNQVRTLLAARDEELTQLVHQHWGAVRSERNPQREQVVLRMRQLISGSSGDPHSGQRTFEKLCGQCHRIYGKGQDVGPDITSNGRSSFDQLLSNVFDPSLVIGVSYQARTVVTIKGRVLTGLLVEDSEQRVVLKTQGGKEEVVPRDEVEEIEVSQLSLMPEGVENQLEPQEIIDLFAFLTLDRHPDEPDARRIPGSP